MRDPVSAPFDALDGRATVLEAVHGLAFPTTKAEAIARVGHLRLADGVALGDVLEGLQANAFHERASAAKAIDRHWSMVARSLAQVAAAERRADE